jgi:hypothetical protein
MLAFAAKDADISARISVLSNLAFVWLAAWEQITMSTASPLRWLAMTLVVTGCVLANLGEGVGRSRTTPSCRVRSRRCWTPVKRERNLISRSSRRGPPLCELDGLFAGIVLRGAFFPENAGGLNGSAQHRPAA